MAHLLCVPKIELWLNFRGKKTWKQEVCEMVNIRGQMRDDSDLDQYGSKRGLRSDCDGCDP
jgi:hypothetical protein